MAPRGWRRVQLYAVADQRTQKVVPTDADTRPYVALEHLAQGSPTLLGWSDANSATSVKTLFREGDTLFGKLRPYLRKAAPAPFDGLCSTDILALFSKDGMDARYLTQLAQWGPLQQHAVATSSGTKMPRTSWQQLGEFEFLLPPPSEQRKIAAMLSSVDDTIEKTQTVIDQVQVVKYGLMDELFASGLPGQHRRFKKTEIGKVPEKWSVARGDELFRLSGGYGPNAIAFEPAGDCLFVKVDALNDPANRRMIRQSRDRFRSEKNPTINTYGCGSLVFPKRGAAIFKNRVRLLGTNVAVDPNLMVLTPNERLNAEFFVLLLLHIRLSSLSDNSGIPQLNNKHLYPKLFVVPPMGEQVEIAKAISSFDDYLDTEQDKISALLVAKHALMSDLLTGELRVTPGAGAP